MQVYVVSPAESARASFGRATVHIGIVLIRSKGNWRLPVGSSLELARAKSMIACQLTIQASAGTSEGILSSCHSLLVLVNL